MYTIRISPIYIYHSNQPYIYIYHLNQLPYKYTFPFESAPIYIYICIPFESAHIYIFTHHPNYLCICHSNHLHKHIHHRNHPRTHSNYSHLCIHIPFESSPCYLNHSPIRISPALFEYEHVYIYFRINPIHIQIFIYIAEYIISR